MQSWPSSLLPLEDDVILKEDLIAWGLRVGAIAIFCATPFQPSRAVRLAGWLIAGGSVAAAGAVEDCDRKRWILQALETVHDRHLIALYKRKLARIVAPADEEEPAAAFEPEAFDWSALGLAPHILISGPTGTGKTVFADWLVRQLKGRTLVLTPKCKASQWRDLAVMGPPRQFDQIEAALEEHIAIMTERIADLDADHEQINLVLDELPACRKNIENFPKLVSTLLCEAREAKIRVIALSQSERVEPLGLAGQGDVIDCLLRVRLGKFALRYAQELANKKLVHPHAFDWFSQQKHPATVGDNLTHIPNLSGWEPDTLFFQPTENGEISATPTENEPKTSETPYYERIVAAEIPPEEIIKINPYTTPEISKWEVEQVRSLYASGKGIVEICWLVYEARSGTRYQKARARIRGILESYAED